MGEDPLGDLACDIADEFFEPGADRYKLRDRVEEALRATAEAARRDAYRDLAKALRDIHDSTETGDTYSRGHADGILSAATDIAFWATLLDAPSPTDPTSLQKAQGTPDLAALKEAVADAVMEQRDEDFCTASWWLTKTKIEKACSALAAAQQKDPTP